MNDILDINWYAVNDKQLLQQIGGFVRYYRIEEKQTQAMLAKDAGISRSTLSLLERGETVTVTTLIQVLRVLGCLYIMNVFLTPTQKKPHVFADIEKRRLRKRVSIKKKEHPDAPDDDFIWI